MNGEKVVERERETIVEVQEEDWKRENEGEVENVVLMSQFLEVVKFKRLLQFLYVPISVRILRNNV